MTEVDDAVLIIDYKPDQIKRLGTAMNSAGFQPVVWVPEEVSAEVRSHLDSTLDMIPNDDRRYGRIWAHTSTARWKETVEARADEQCRLTLYTSGAGIEAADTVGLSMQYDKVTNIDVKLDNDQAFIQALRQYREEPGQPFALKTVTDNREISTALAILCQGYLAAYAANQTNDENAADPVLTTALGQMGWTGLPVNSASTLKDRLRGKFEEVQGALWWSEPFGLWTEARSDGVVDEGWLLFEERIAKEWDLKSFDELPAILKTTVARIKSNQNLDSPSDVAALYCKLVEFVGGRRCTT